MKYIEAKAGHGFMESAYGNGSLCVLQGLKMTDGLKSLAVCNHSFVEVSNSYPYRSYELLTVQVSLSDYIHLH